MRNGTRNGKAGRARLAAVRGRVAMAFAVCGAALLLTAAPAPAQGFVRTETGMGLRAPDGWRPLATGPNMPFAAVGPDNGKFSPKITLTVRRASGATLPPDQGSRMTRQLMKSLPGYRIVSKGRFLLAGTEAVMVSGVYPAPESSGLGGLPLRNCVVCTVRGGQVYTFTFTTDRENFGGELPVFTGVVDSVRWGVKGRSALAKPAEKKAGPAVSLDGGAGAAAVTLPEAKVAFDKPEGFIRLKFNKQPAGGPNDGKLLYGAARPSGGDFATNFILSQRPAPGPAFPSDMATVTDRIFGEQFPGAQVVGQSRGNLAGTSSYTVLFDFPVQAGGPLVRVRYVMLLKGPWLYTFAFLSDRARFDEDDPTFNEILSSIRWL